MPSLKQTRDSRDDAALEARRDFLKLFALALGGSQLVGCARAPNDPIVPAVVDTVSEDIPTLYATTLAHGGYASGVLVKTRYGHPVKIEGNPLHPASLGGTDIFSQAAIYSLWDTQRSAPVQRRGKLSSWKEFLDALHARLATVQDGKSLRVLAEPSTSPTLRRLRAELTAKFPASRWHTYAPLVRDNVYKGSDLAFGKALEPSYDFSRAAVVVSLDADFVTALPGSIRYARDFAARREPSPEQTPARLYCIESSPNSASILADHRISLRPHEIQMFAAELLTRLENGAVESDTPLSKWASAIAKNLAAHRGASIVLCGDHQAAEVHYLAHAINAQLGNIGKTVSFAEPLLDSTDQLASMRDLCADIRDGTVDTLIILGGNPAYTAPHDTQFAGLIDRVSWTAHLGSSDDETSLHCDWHLPLAHDLETWSDARAYDGTSSIAQPAIAPLHQGKSVIEFVSAMLGANESDYDLVRETWRLSMTTEFETTWLKSLHDGFVARPLPTITPVFTARHESEPPAPPQGALDFLFRADASTGDGSHASNAWLQELPKPFSQLTWSNAAMLSPATAKRFSIADEDVVQLTVGDAWVDAPALIQDGIADECVVLPLGYGRTRGGEVASGIGFDAAAIRNADAFWHARGSLRKTGKVRPLARTQRHALNGQDGPVRVDTFPRESKPEAVRAQPSLFAPRERSGDYAWGMAINLNNCMGCNVCTIACQSENNIPTVGSDQVRRGRAMHWIRVDHYVEAAQQPRLHSQPVPCMHCENAPCEVACPVGATVHDSEGLNVQVYNRCIGTRFCANNCPYKVRRFNFLQFSQPSSRDYANPDVTVRNRGVMEKCSYCVQRIETARIETDKAGRELRDGDIVTACEAACPTSAIVFGNLNDPESAVSRAKADPRNYALLGELNTNPRTTYLSKLRIVNPELDDA